MNHRVGPLLARTQQRALGRALLPAVVGLLAGLAPGPSAEALTPVWTATLTVGVTANADGGAGYYAPGQAYGPHGSLSEDEFDFNGATYTVVVLATSTHGGDFLFRAVTGDPAETADKSDLDALTLQLQKNDGTNTFEDFPIADASEISDENGNFRWRAPGTRFTELPTGQRDGATMRVRLSKVSTDATLSGLTLEDASDNSPIGLDQTFASGTTSYTASVGYSVNRITIRPTSEKYASIVWLDASSSPIADADPHKRGQQVSLNVGSNTIKLKVTAEDTVTTRTYTLTVTRAATISTDATLSGLTLEWPTDDSPVALNETFASATTSYSATVAHGVNRITIRPTKNHGQASIAFRKASDRTIADADTGKAGQQVSLRVGANTIRVRVTAEDGATVRTYTLTVTRARRVRPTVLLDTTLSVRSYSNGHVAGCSGSRSCNDWLGQNEFVSTGTDGIGRTVRIDSLKLGKPGSPVRLDEPNVLNLAFTDTRLGNYELLSLVLEVDGRRFPFRDSDAGGCHSRHWGDLSISWRGGQNVRVRILDEANSGTLGRGDRSIPPYWTCKPRLLVKNATAVEGDDETMDFEVRLSPASSRQVTVDYATSNGNAKEGEDYRETDGRLTYAPGETSQTVSVPIINDSHEDSGERFYLTLRNASPGVEVYAYDGVVSATATAVGTIYNDEEEEAESLGNAEGFTASYSNVPAGHGGELFTYDMDFSANMTGPMSYATLKFGGVRATNATVRRAKRRPPGQDHGWTIHVIPDAGAGDVVISLPAATDCAEDGAVCDAHGKMLTSGYSFTVPRDAPVATPESPGDAEGFTASYSNAPAGHGRRTVHLRHGLQREHDGTDELRDAQVRGRAGDQRHGAARKAPTAGARPWLDDSRHPRHGRRRRGHLPPGNHRLRRGRRGV